MANAPIKMEVLSRLPLPSNANQQSNVNQYREAYNQYMPTVPNLNPVWNTGVPVPAPAAVMQPTPVATITQSAVPAPTVEQNIADKNKTSLQIGANIGNQQAEASRKADMTKTLMGGDMGKFMANLLRMFAQPEFQQAGFAGQGFGPTVLGATRALRAMETQDIEAAKLQAAADKEALEQAAAARAEERALRGLDIQQQRADIARSTAERDRIRAANITGPKIDSFVQAIKGNKTFIESIDSLTGGNFLQRLAPGVQGGPSQEDVVRAVALEAANVSNQNPRLSTPDAIKQAIANIKGGGSAPTQSTNNNGVDPFANVGG
jgi:hypothetical protein